MCVWPQARFGWSPPSFQTLPPSHAIGPSLPALPLLSSPCHLPRFAMLRERAPWAGVGGGVLGCRRVEGKVPPTGTWSQTHILGFLTHSPKPFDSPKGFWGYVNSRSKVTLSQEQHTFEHFGPDRLLSYFWHALISLGRFRPS